MSEVPLHTNIFSRASCARETHVASSGKGVNSARGSDLIPYRSWAVTYDFKQERMCLQGCLVHQKQSTPRTLQQGYA